MGSGASTALSALRDSTVDEIRDAFTSLTDVDRKRVEDAIAAASACKSNDVSHEGVTSYDGDMLAINLVPLSGEQWSTCVAPSRAIRFFKADIASHLSMKAYQVHLSILETGCVLQDDNALAGDSGLSSGIDIQVTMLPEDVLAEYHFNSAMGRWIDQILVEQANGGSDEVQSERLAELAQRVLSALKPLNPASTLESGKSVPMPPSDDDERYKHADAEGLHAVRMHYLQYWQHFSQQRVVEIQMIQEASTYFSSSRPGCATALEEVIGWVRGLVAAAKFRARQMTLKIAEEYAAAALTASTWPPMKWCYLLGEAIKFWTMCGGAAPGSSDNEIRLNTISEQINDLRRQEAFVTVLAAFEKSLLHMESDMVTVVFDLVAAVVRWQYAPDSDDDNDWQFFDTRTNMSIEAAFAQGRSECRSVQRKGKKMHTYEIQLAKQTYAFEDQSGSGHSGKLRRSLTSPEDSASFISAAQCFYQDNSEANELDIPQLLEQVTTCHDEAVKECAGKNELHLATAALETLRRQTSIADVHDKREALTVAEMIVANILPLSLRQHEDWRHLV